MIKVPFVKHELQDKSLFVTFFSKQIFVKYTKRKGPETTEKAQAVRSEGCGFQTQEAVNELVESEFYNLSQSSLNLVWADANTSGS